MRQQWVTLERANWLTLIVFNPIWKIFLKSNPTWELCSSYFLLLFFSLKIVISNILPLRNDYHIYISSSVINKWECSFEPYSYIAKERNMTKIQYSRLCWQVKWGCTLAWWHCHYLIWVNAWCELHMRQGFCRIGEFGTATPLGQITPELQWNHLFVMLLLWIHLLMTISQDDVWLPVEA